MVAQQANLSEDREVLRPLTVRFRLTDKGEECTISRYLVADCNTRAIEDHLAVRPRNASAYLFALDAPSLMKIGIVLSETDFYMRLPTTRHVCGECNKMMEGVSPKSEKRMPVCCEQCRMIYYCSAACQKEHWERAHQHDCSVLKFAFVGHMPLLFMMRMSALGTGSERRSRRTEGR